MIEKDIQDQLYDPKRSSWLDFVKQHKHMRTAKGLLDLKAISKLWRGKNMKDGMTHQSYDPAPKKTRSQIEAEIRRDTQELQEHMKKPRSWIGKKWDRKIGKWYDIPKSWYNAMKTGISKRSDVRDPDSVVRRIWSRLSKMRKASIRHKANRGERFKYDLPLPQDMPTLGRGTLRIVKPFKLAEAQINVKTSDMNEVKKSGIFESMRRQDGSICQVARCKSKNRNVNIFVDRM